MPAAAAAAPTYSPVEVTYVETLLNRPLTSREFRAVRRYNEGQLRALRVANRRALRGAPAEPKADRTLGIISFVLGVVGIFLPVLLPSVAAIVLGVRGIRKFREQEGRADGLAIAGLVLGIMGTILSLIVIGAVIAFAGSSFGPG